MTWHQDIQQMLEKSVPYDKGDCKIKKQQKDWKREQLGKRWVELIKKHLDDQKAAPTV